MNTAGRGRVGTALLGTGKTIVSELSQRRRSSSVLARRCAAETRRALCCGRNAAGSAVPFLGLGRQDGQVKPTQAASSGQRPGLYTSVGEKRLDPGEALR